MSQFKKLPQELALGRFRLIAQLGRGGMAEVFLARLIGAGGFEKLVAIKRMLPEVSRNPTFVAMFHREGRIAAQLDHPNICHVYELGEDQGTLFLAMELLRGLPWSDIVPAIPDRPQIAAVRFIIGFAIQVCDGLHHAHTAVGADLQTHPIVHRDVSPANLFVTNEGMVKLLDFGVSKVMTDATLTANGVPRGTLPYMAPEQMHGHAIDARADVFSLAVVLWEALAGRALFGRASPYDTVMAVAEASVPALPGDGPVIARLDGVLRRALAGDRAQRPSSARELAQQLRWALGAYGEPMIASEIEAHLAQWLGSSLSRRNKDLAEILGRAARTALDDELSGEQTAPQAAQRTAGARLREVAIVVGASRVTAGSPASPAPGEAQDTVIAPALISEMMAIPSSGPQHVVAIPPTGQTVIDIFPPTRPVPVPHVAIADAALPPTRPVPRIETADDSLTGEQTNLRVEPAASVSLSEAESTRLHAQPGYPEAPRITQRGHVAQASDLARPWQAGQPARAAQPTPAQPGYATQRGHVAQPQPGHAAPLAQPGSVAPLGRVTPDGRGGRVAAIASAGTALPPAVPILLIVVIAVVVAAVIAVVLFV